VKNLTEDNENADLTLKATRLKKVNLGIDITGLILSCFAIYFGIMWPFANWNAMGIFQLFASFGFSDRNFGIGVITSNFKSDICVLLALLCFCGLLFLCSLLHSLSNPSLLKFKFIFGIIGILLSTAIIVLIRLMAISFFEYSAVANPGNVYSLTGCYNTTLVFCCFAICFSLTQIILSFVKIPPKPILFSGLYSKHPISY